jgi:hypothetical protein
VSLSARESGGRYYRIVRNSLFVCGGVTCRAACGEINESASIRVHPQLIQSVFIRVHPRLIRSVFIRVHLRLI